MKSAIRSGLVTTAVGLVAVLSACGGGSGDTATESGSDAALSGAVVIDGSSTVEPLSSAAAELFQGENPGVNVTVGTSGTGGGFQKFCAGETDISDASREISDSEIKLCEAAGIAYTPLTVANDALTVVVNKDNTWASCLTVDQLTKMWANGSKVSNWNEIDPSFPDQKLALYGPGPDSGTFDYFTDAVNGEEGNSRTDYNPSEDDNVIVQGVSGDAGGLGYFGFSYYEENADKLKAVEIDGGAGCVAPSVESAQGGTYTPLARELFIYASDAGLAKPQVEAFVEFYLEQNQAIVEAAQFIPLTPEQVVEEQAALEALRSGAGASADASATVTTTSGG